MYVITEGKINKHKCHLLWAFYGEMFWRRLKCFLIKRERGVRNIVRLPKCNHTLVLLSVFDAQMCLAVQDHRLRTPQNMTEA